jgi:hypothetical protein
MISISSADHLQLSLPIDVKERNLLSSKDTEDRGRIFTGQRG